MAGLGPTETGVIAVSCHCGKTKFEVPHLPENIGRCNCSICSRLGTLWAYYPPDQVNLTHVTTTTSYIWGDKMMAIHHCTTCGCTTHWTNLDDPAASKIGVNARMFIDIDLDTIPIRQIDGASY